MGAHPNETLTAATKQEAAAYITERLLRRIDGDVTDPATWERFARSVGIEVRLYCIQGASRGQCAPAMVADSDLLAGLVRINTAYPALEQARAWVHELSHLAHAAWIPTQLRSGADGYSYEGDDRHEVSHEVARMVENLILGTHESE